MSIIIGIDHGYYAIKTAHCSFPAGLTSYGEHEPYTRQGLLEFGGCFFVCGTGRQPIQRDKTANDNYYLLTLAAIAKEIRQRGLPPECSVRIAAGLPLTSFGRDKPKFKDYLLQSNQPVNYKFEGVEYSITIEEVAIFPQGYAALMTEVGLLQDEPSMLLMDLGGWTVDLMRIDNALPAADTAHSLELGMIRCVDDIREQVRRETGLSLTDAQIENMLAGQPCTVSDTVRDIVNRQGRKYTEHLLSATMEAGFDLHAIPAVLLGGGASVVSRHLSPKDGLTTTTLYGAPSAWRMERSTTATVKVTIPKYAHFRMHSAKSMGFPSSKHRKRCVESGNMKSGGLRKTTNPHGALPSGRMWTKQFNKALHGGNFLVQWNAKGMKSAWGASIPFCVRPERSALFASKRWASGTRQKPSRRASCIHKTIARMWKKLLPFNMAVCTAGRSPIAS